MAEKTRASKSGIGYEVDKKMEQNYDREEQQGTPARIVEWINAILEGEAEKITDTDWKSICMALRDGTMLCKLANKLRKEAKMPPIHFQKKALSPFVAMTNIEAFNKGIEEYGCAREFLFQSGDLYEVRKGPFLNVINSLHSLGFVANDKHFPIKYQGDIQKKMDMD